MNDLRNQVFLILFTTFYCIETKRLTEEEYKTLRSQIVTLNSENKPLRSQIATLKTKIIF